MGLVLTFLFIVSLSMALLYYRYQFIPIALAASFEEIDRNPQSYDGVRVALIGYLIKSESPLQYYLTPDFLVITNPPATKMALLIGNSETLDARFDLESKVAIIADFPWNITQISNKKVMAIGRVDYIVYWGGILPASILSPNGPRDGWCLIPEYVYEYIS